MNNNLPIHQYVINMYIIEGIEYIVIYFYSLTYLLLVDHCKDHFKFLCSMRVQLQLDNSWTKKDNRYTLLLCNVFLFTMCF